MARGLEAQLAAFENASDDDDSSDGGASEDSDDTAEEVWTPTRIASLSGRGIVDIAAGYDASGDAGHTVAVTRRCGTVLACGSGVHGQLGTGLPQSSTPVPVAIWKAADGRAAPPAQAWAAKRTSKKGKQAKQ